MSLTKVTSRVLDILAEDLKFQTPAPGIWLDETNGATPKGALIQLNDNMLRIARRAANFGAFESTVVNINIMAPGNTVLVNANGTLTVAEGFVGVSDASNPIAGVIGEHVIASVFSTAPVALTNNVVTIVATINLTAGDWDIDGSISVDHGAATVTLLTGGISTSPTAFLSSSSSIYSAVRLTTTTTTNGVAIPRFRLNTNAASTPVYLLVRSTFSAGTSDAYGHISARRVR